MAHRPPLTPCRSLAVYQLAPFGPIHHVAQPSIALKKRYDLIRRSQQDPVKSEAADRAGVDLETRHTSGSISLECNLADGIRRFEDFRAHRVKHFLAARVPDLELPALDAHRVDYAEFVAPVVTQVLRQFFRCRNGP